jgi:hypothetical protein
MKQKSRANVHATLLRKQHNLVLLFLVQKRAFASSIGGDYVFKIKTNRNLNALNINEFTNEKK